MLIFLASAFCGVRCALSKLGIASVSARKGGACCRCGYGVGVGVGVMEEVSVVAVVAEVG